MSNSLTPSLYSDLAPTTNIGVYTIGPDMAAWLLETRNTANPRKATQTRVDRYAAMMADGEWIAALSPLNVAEDGSVQNGQHRLRAVVQYGAPVDFLVVFGMPEQAADYYDHAKSSRTASDMMIQNGITVKNVGTTMNVFDAFVNGKSDGKNIDTSKYSAWLAANPTFKDDLERADEIVKLSATGLTAGRRTRLRAAVLLLLTVGWDVDTLSDFAAEVDGTGPLYKFTSRTLDELQLGSGGFFQAVHILLHAFRKFIYNDDVTQRFNLSQKVPFDKIVRPS